jgi:hypothetical protein
MLFYLFSWCIKTPLCFSLCLFILSLFILFVLYFIVFLFRIRYLDGTWSQNYEGTVHVLKMLCFPFIRRNIWAMNEWDTKAVYPVHHIPSSPKNSKRSEPLSPVLCSPNPWAKILLKKQRLTAVGTRCADHVTPLCPQKVVTNFADRRRPLCRYSSLAD